MGSNPTPSANQNQPFGCKVTARISFSWRLSTIAFLHARFATFQLVPKGPPAPKIGNPPSSPAHVAARKSSQRTAETSGFLPGDLFSRSARRSQPRVSERCPIFPHPQRHWSGQIWTRQSRLEGDEPKKARQVSQAGLRRQSGQTVGSTERRPAEAYPVEARLRSASRHPWEQRGAFPNPSARWCGARPIWPLNRVVIIGLGGPVFHERLCRPRTHP